MPIRVLVTGCSGFIGSAVTVALAQAGYRIRAASRQLSKVAELHGVEWVQIPNLEQRFEWAPYIEGVDVVVHLAAIAHRRPGQGAEYEKVNRDATARLAQACIGRDVKRFIFFSSIGAQAGSAADFVVTEQHDPAPVTAYDRSKLAAEEEIRRSGIPFTILRPVLVYGEGAKANIALMIRVAQLPVALPFGAFKNRRSLLSIENLTDAVKFCIESQETVNRTFIVTDPAPIELAEIFATLRKAAGRRPLLFPVPPLAFKPLLLAVGKGHLWDRLGRSLVASSAELQRVGWTPTVETKVGLRTMMEALVRSKAGSNE
jgi:nucleoside-diphosphate-sugar epimerase